MPDANTKHPYLLTYIQGELPDQECAWRRKLTRVVEGIAEKRCTALTVLRSCSAVKNCVTALITVCGNIMHCSDLEQAIISWKFVFCTCDRDGNAFTSKTNYNFMEIWRAHVYSCNFGWRINACRRLKHRVRRSSGQIVRVVIWTSVRMELKTRPGKQYSMCMWTRVHKYMHIRTSN